MKYLKYLFISALTVLAPIKMALITVFTLVMADMVLGVYIAIRDKKFTSAGLGRTLSKLVIYEMALVLGFLCETYLTGAEVPVSKVISGFIGLTELTSLIENLNNISGVNLLKALVVKVSSRNGQDTNDK